MKFFNNLTKKATELKEKTQDRIKANGGLEGILQKTSKKVDTFAEAASEKIKKTTDEAKQYIQEAKDSAQQQGDNGFIGVAKTLGTKVGTDVSSLVRNGYEKIAASESIQNLKKELQEEDDKNTAAHPKSPSVDFSKITLEHIFTLFFSGVQSGNEWTTASQPNNPKNERLKKITYIVNGQEWFNKETQESGTGAFDLTLDFLANQTGLSLTDPESSKELVKKTRIMITKLVEELHSEEMQAKQAKESTSVASQKPEEKVQTVAATAETKAPVAKKTPARKTVVKAATAETKAPVAKKTPARKTVVKDVTAETKAPVAKKTPARKTMAAKKANGDSGKKEK